MKDWASNLFQNLLIVLIFLIIGVLVYCAITKKTLLDFVKEVKEIVHPAQA